MKVISVLFSLSIMMLGLTACNRKGVKFAPNPPPVIVDPLDYKSIAGDIIAVTPLCNSGSCGEKSVVTMRFTLGGCVRELEGLEYRVSQRRNEVVVDAYYLNPPPGTACTLDALFYDEEITVSLVPPFDLYFSGTDISYEIDDYFVDEDEF